MGGMSSRSACACAEWPVLTACLLLCLPGLQGRGKYGALGLGDFENQSTPTLVSSLAGVAVRQVSLGDDHTVLLAEGGAVYSMGR